MYPNWDFWFENKLSGNPGFLLTVEEGPFVELGGACNLQVWRSLPVIDVYTFREIGPQSLFPIQINQSKYLGKTSFTHNSYTLNCPF
jgi:hypothetical protein